MLKNYFNEEELIDIYDAYEPTVLEKLDEKNMNTIIEYLNNNVTITKDILHYYLDLFTIESEEFIQNFEKLKGLLGDNYAVLLEENISFLERMYHL